MAAPEIENGASQVAAAFDEALARLACGVVVRVADYEQRLGDDIWQLVVALRADSALGAAIRLASSEPVLYPWTWRNYTVHRGVGAWSGGPAFAATEISSGRPARLLFPVPDGRGTDAVRLRAGVEHKALASVRIVRMADGSEALVGADSGGGTLDRADMVHELEGRSDEVRALCAAWADVADALHALHAAGLVHGHIAPSAIVCGPENRLTLLDASSEEDEARRSAAVACMPIGRSCVSPEELQTGHATALSDVFALAAVAHDLLSGVLASDAAKGRRRYVPPRVSMLPIRGARLRKAVEEALAAALAPDPTNRCPSARTLGETLRAASRTSRSWLRRD